MLFGTVIYVILAVVGASHFESWLDTLLVILSVGLHHLSSAPQPFTSTLVQYWLAIYCTILIEEHFIFRKGRWSNYNVADWKRSECLPLGVAAAVSMCIGIMGAVLGTIIESRQRRSD